MSFVILLLIGLIILVSITLVRVNNNTRRIEELYYRIQGLKKSVEGEEKSPAIKPTVSDKKIPAKIEAPAQTSSVKDPEISFEMLGGGRPEPPAEKVREEKKSMTKSEWEILIGGKVLNRIGAVAIILGISFFLKYAFDNNWISESVRVIIGAVVGFLFIGGGLKSYQKDYKIFSQGMAGTGISILYLSVYASFNYYYLVSQPVAFVLMSTVTVLAFAQAFYFNSMAVSLIGFFGGFITPFLLSTGHANEIGLFSYLTLLNSGLILVAMRKSEWMLLETLAVISTYSIYFVWYVEYFDTGKATVALVFTTIFWAIFFAANIIHIVRSNRLNGELRLFTATFNLFLYGIAIYIILDDVYPDWTGFAAIFLAGLHSAFYYYIQKYRKSFSHELNFALLSTIILFSLFIYFQFSGYTIVILWSINLLILYWLGVKYKTDLLISSGIILTFITAIKFMGTEGIFSYQPIDEFTLLFNYRSLAYFIPAAVFGMNAMILNNSEYSNSKTLKSGYLYLLCITLCIFIYVETNDYFRAIYEQNKDVDYQMIQFRELLTISGLWVYYSLILAFIGYRKNLIELIISSSFVLGMGVLMAVLVGITYYPLKDFQLAFNYRVLILVLILLSTFTHIYILDGSRNMYGWLNNFFRILQVVSVVVLLTLITAEIKDYYNREISLLDTSSYDYNEILAKLKNMQQMLLSTSWLVVSSLLIVIGIWKKIWIMRITAIVLFGAAILKMFLYDLSFLDTLYRIISFIGLGLILLAASFAYQKYKKFIFN